MADKHVNEKKKKKSAKEETANKKVKKAKKASSSSSIKAAEVNEHQKPFDDPSKLCGIEQQPLPSKLMRMAGYDENDENVLGSSHETTSGSGGGTSSDFWMLNEIWTLFF